MPKAKVAIVGATGFTGSELLRFLPGHPDIEIIAVTSESYKGQLTSEVHPFLSVHIDLPLVSADKVPGLKPDLVFLALPHGVSMDYVKKWYEEDFKIIDLSGDFRLDKASTYEEWYNKSHHFEEGFKDSAYGLPEIHRERISKSELIANPGCYPTVSILTLLPLLAHKNFAQTRDIIIDAKSGVTGAGAKAKELNHYSNVNENFRAYGIKTHRHSIEIQQQLSGVAHRTLSIQFTPHLLPVDRGILATCYIKNPKKLPDAKVKLMYTDFYKNEPFVRLRDQIPAIKDVRGTNFCDIHVTSDDRTGNIIAVGVIDNLIKGAAGQAIQNMNLMLGLEETAGLKHVALRP